MPHKPISRGGTRVARRPWAVRLAWMGVLVLALAVIIQPVQALAYFFAVPKATIDVTVNADGTVSLDYDYNFQNQPSGDPIQYVDIGMPTTDYDLGSASGTVDGQAVNVERSTEVKGIALNLGSLAIPPGQSGEVKAHIGTVRGMLFKANAQQINRQEPYGSFQFEPNFFGPQYVTGSTDLTVTLHLPPGMNQDEPIYFTPQNWPGPSEPEAGFDANGGVFYRWRSAGASSSDKYTFGAAFPARLVPAGALLTENPLAGLNLNALCPWIICLGFAGFLGFTIWASITGNKRRRLQYLPPKISVEGNGIKRGLTAVEAAILMEQPMDKILTMILFSVIKKGAATVVSRNPMKLQVASPRPDDLRTYESEFLDAMDKSQVSEQRRGLQDMMTNLVKSVAEKMRGFSRKETVAYYQDIMNKAWQQVEQAQTPEMKMQAFDDAIDWTMLDRRFNDRTRDTFGPGPVIVPMWWGRFDPAIGHQGMGGVSAARPSTPSVSSVGNTPPTGLSLPSLPGADFASSMVVGMQNFSANVIGNLTSFTGGVTNKTNPVPVPQSTPSRGGGFGGSGGGHCACACACACAGCACACAGGGR